MYVSQKTNSYYTFLIYWLMIIIGSFFLMNLVIAILANEFVKAEEKIKLNFHTNKKPITSFSFRKLNHLGIYVGNNTQRSNAFLNNMNL